MVTDASPFVVNLKAELNGLRNTVLGVLDYPAELVPVINRLSFAQCAYLLSVYRLETLRFVFKDSWQCVCVWFLPARNRECAVYFCEHLFREYDILTAVLVKKHLLFYPWIFVNNVHSCVRGSIWTQCESDEFGSIWPVLVPCFFMPQVTCILFSECEIQVVCFMALLTVGLFHFIHPFLLR